MGEEEAISVSEAEWFNCFYPTQMIEAIRGDSPRKLRLLVVAFCRSEWNLFELKESRYAVEVAEMFADGLARLDDLVLAREKALSGALGIDLDRIDALHPVYAAADDAWKGASMLCRWVAVFPDPKEFEEKRRQVQLLRDIFGNPFRPPPPIDPSLLTPAIVALADDIYQQRTFERLPELATALVAGGCRDAELVEHLRGPGPHVRGCWALDLVLGKQ